MLALSSLLFYFISSEVHPSVKNYTENPCLVLHPVPSTLVPTLSGVTEGFKTTGFAQPLTSFWKTGLTTLIHAGQ